MGCHWAGPTLQPVTSRCRGRGTTGGWCGSMRTGIRNQRLDPGNELAGDLREG